MNTRKAVRTITNDEAEAVYEGPAPRVRGPGCRRRWGRDEGRTSLVPPALGLRLARTEDEPRVEQPYIPAVIRD